MLTKKKPRVINAILELRKEYAVATALLEPVAVTEVEAITPFGDLDQTWERLLAGDSVMDRITAFDPEGYRCQIAGEIRNFDPTKYGIDPKILKRTGKAEQLALAVVTRILESSGLPEKDFTDTGVMMGCNIAGTDVLTREHEVLKTKGSARVSPQLPMRTMQNLANGVISSIHNLRGGGFAPASACATGAQAIGEALIWVRSWEDIRAMVAGGFESMMHALLLAGFDNIRGVMTKDNINPSRAVKPFDKLRDGFGAAEGAAAFLIERLSRALGRRARIRATILGYGASYDGRKEKNADMTTPTGEGAALAMSRALSRSGIKPHEVDYINAHATGTMGDKVEAWAIRQVFGDAADRIPVSSFKGALGHSMGGSGAVESALCIKVLETGIVPPNTNCENPDNSYGLDLVLGEPRYTKPAIALKNSFGFGGVNACLVFKRYDN